MRSSAEHVRGVICQHFPEHSEAAKYWDSLKPEWRRLVLHAASLHGAEALSSGLAECNWRELYARLDHRRMLQLRAGIQHARNLFAGFGSLRQQDFSPRTARRITNKTCTPQQSAAVLPASTANLIAGRNQLRQR